MRILERDMKYIVLSGFYLRLSTNIHWTGTSPVRHKIDHTQVNLIQLKTFELELDFAEYIQHTGVQIADLCWALLYTIYRVTSYLQLLPLSFVSINAQPEYELSGSTRFGQFQKFGKIWLWGTVLPATPKKTISARGLEFLLIDIDLRVIFDLPGSINLRNINGFPKLGPKTLIRGHHRGSKVVPLDSTGMISY